MADELFESPEGGTVAAEAPRAGEALPHNQPQPVGDSRLADILRRQSAGEKLSASDRGYLGAVKRKGSPEKIIAEANPNPLLEAPANPDNPLFAAESQPQAPAATVALTAADSARIRDAAEALLDSLDSTTKIWIASEARAAGADPDTVARYEAAVALQPRNRKLMADNSEPVVLTLCKVFRCTPEKLPNMIRNCGFMIGLWAHGAVVTATVKSIRESKKEKEATV
jgi:hypothetical protein